MDVLVDYCARPSVGESALRRGDGPHWFYEWELPDNARKGDTAVLYAGGRRRCYLGLERIQSDWQVARTGPLAGEEFIEADWKFFGTPVPAAAVEEALGIKAPSGPATYSSGDGQRLVQFLTRRKARDSEAIEGILTESRRTSRSRNVRLRRLKLEGAGGVCEACRRDFSAISPGLDGRRVLTVHHRHQLSAFDEPRTTSIDELAVLCANCHMLIHANPKSAMSVEALSRLICEGGS